jgi:hypothetical protein
MLVMQQKAMGSSMAEIAEPEIRFSWGSPNLSGYDHRQLVDQNQIKDNEILSCVSVEDVQDDRLR